MRMDHFHTRAGLNIRISAPRSDSKFFFNFSHRNEAKCL